MVRGQYLKTPRQALTSPAENKGRFLISNMQFRLFRFGHRPPRLGRGMCDAGRWTASGVVLFALPCLRCANTYLDLSELQQERTCHSCLSSVVVDGRQHSVRLRVCTPAGRHTIAAPAGGWVENLH